jgi:hypothetical protein
MEYPIPYVLFVLGVCLLSARNRYLVIHIIFKYVKQKQKQKQILSSFLQLLPLYSSHKIVWVKISDSIDMLQTQS